MIDIRPPWLRAMENGTIGEARTRSFLLDRFWVLERSVDVEGADFIIMRRHTRKSLLDSVPPRLGFVQVKFFESEDTTARVHEEYIVGPNGKPRPEFFVVAHTGREASARTYFLTAERIAADFTLDDADGGKRFVLRGKSVLSDAYRAPSPNVVLDVIERALERADSGHNRDFMLWVLPSAREAPSLPERFSTPLPIEGADLLGSFRALQKAAEHALYRIDEVRDPLESIAKSSDPLEAFALAEELKALHTGHSGTHVGFQHGYDEDAHRHWLAYSELHDLLEEHRLVLPVAEMRRQFEDTARRALYGLKDAARDALFVIVYAPTDLRVRESSASLVEHVAPDNDHRWERYRATRFGPERVELLWRTPALFHCSHRAKPREEAVSKRVTECDEHLLRDAGDAFAVALQDIVKTRFPDEKFTHYVVE